MTENGDCIVAIAGTGRKQVVRRAIDADTEQVEVGAVVEEGERVIETSVLELGKILPWRRRFNLGPSGVSAMVRADLSAGKASQLMPAIIDAALSLFAESPLLALPEC